jgi:hypothetical protein
MANRERNERVQIMLSREELRAIDNFRYSNRLPTRAAAFREALRRGLKAGGKSLSLGVQSRDFGVLEQRHQQRKHRK